jgi:DNA mismatch endonuclease (patch repair protein)
MRLVKARDTRPELALRKLIYSLGYRYRVCDKSLPGRPDIVFKGKRKVIFVHGCFWHRHDGCKMTRFPKTQREFWANKFLENQARDQRSFKKLEELGWQSLVIWECEMHDTVAVQHRVEGFLNA